MSLMLLSPRRGGGSCRFKDGTDCVVGGMEDEDPYLTETKTSEVRIRNPHFGDDRICRCGHSYDRHFDPFESEAGMSCKYCHCYNWKEPEGDLGDALRHVELLEGPHEVKQSLRRILVEALKKVANLRLDHPEGTITRGPSYKPVTEYIIHEGTLSHLRHVRKELTGAPFIDDEDAEEE